MKMRQRKIATQAAASYERNNLVGGRWGDYDSGIGPAVRVSISDDTEETNVLLRADLAGDTLNSLPANMEITSHFDGDALELVCDGIKMGIMTEDEAVRIITNNPPKRVGVIKRAGARLDDGRDTFVPIDVPTYRDEMSIPSKELMSGSELVQRAVGTGVKPKIHTGQPALILGSAGLLAHAAAGVLKDPHKWVEIDSTNPSSATGVQVLPSDSEDNVSEIRPLQPDLDMRDRLSNYLKGVAENRAIARLASMMEPTDDDVGSQNDVDS